MSYLTPRTGGRPRSLEDMSKTYETQSEAPGRIEGSEAASVRSSMSVGREVSRSPDPRRRTLSPADLRGLKERRGGPLGHARARSVRIVATENPNSGRWYGYPDADEIVLSTRVVSMEQLLNMISDRLKQPIRAIYLESGDRVDRMEMLPSRKGIDLYATERRNPPERLSVDSRDEILAAIGRAANPTRAMPPRSPVTTGRRPSPSPGDSGGTDINLGKMLDYSSPSKAAPPVRTFEPREAINVPPFSAADLERLERLSRVEDEARTPHHDLHKPQEVDLADMQIRFEGMASELKSQVDQMLRLHDNIIRRLAAERDAYATEAETLHSELRTVMRRSVYPPKSTLQNRPAHWQ